MCELICGQQLRAEWIKRLSSLNKVNLDVDDDFCSYTFSQFYIEEKKRFWFLHLPDGASLES